MRLVFPFREVGLKLYQLTVCVLMAGVLAACSEPRQRAPVEDRLPSTRPVGTPAAAAASKPMPGAENAGKPGYYTVKPGDTLARIGLEAGQNWRAGTALTTRTSLRWGKCFVSSGRALNPWRRPPLLQPQLAPQRAGLLLALWAAPQGLTRARWNPSQTQRLPAHPWHQRPPRRLRRSPHLQRRRQETRTLRGFGRLAARFWRALMRREPKAW